MTTGSTTKIDSVIERLDSSADTDQVFEALEDVLMHEKDFHRLFDAKLIRTRHQLGLPLSEPTSLDNIPSEHQSSFRDAYIDAARTVGQLLLENDQLTDAWTYFRTIGEPDPVREVIDRVSIPQDPDESFDEVMNVALYEGAHMVKGLEFLLKTHGTCNSVTTLSQLQQQMTFEERRQSAALLVRQIYSDLQHSLRSDLESRDPAVDGSASIRELMTGQEVLFAEGNYHIDVSHLHSIVGFARSLTPDDPELELAIELSEYGNQLSESLQYPGNPPFDRYYEAHLHFLNALAGRNAEDALEWFIGRMDAEAEDGGKRLVAFVILDLGQRTDQDAVALVRTAPVLANVQDPGGFSFTSLCVEQGRLDLLEETARSRDDVIAWATARFTALNSSS
ncbi:MAG: hypothetical protein MK110_16915 [Fuerstiella sp.]|nr:hypothetical protein [Fuerstiella sp.]